MAKKRTKPTLPYPALDRAIVLKSLADEGLEVSDLHLNDFYRLLHNKKYPDLSEFPWGSGFPKRFKDHMMSKFVTRTTKVILSQISSNGSTTKLLIELHDGHQVESVIMRHETGRTTLCVSSQVGCQMGCTFCKFN
jgi:adenine C2-methylase RlmN of 23S rRNA A2503 and tRNA A37